ncbi:hypothetical protein CFOL_v3_08643 [Cephalotus follicularis]|uniref:Uncharacterized protein n=1 Tax=Cephalotus follicularis TaxID=3775 RepID=A0A1Q3BAX2_CEPFO|nr:hypothetical protein CFOL_v3_08643 [Cephalotus follicularis]
MEDIQSPTTAQMEGCEETGEDFDYEQMEAPKFVDLTAPDRGRPVNDDSQWFCLRVGCDQKHEEEMDSEAIYKNFVLRVMAARSPSVRLCKALYREHDSKNVKCPLTVPAKSSKSRISRLAMISSIPQRVVDGKNNVPALPKLSETPNAKAKPQSTIVAKGLTTPRNKKGLSKPDSFRSVRNPKPTTIAVPQNRVVAKALVFRSPKKTVKIKTSVEFKSSVKMLCSGMKKLEITCGKKHLLGCSIPLPLDQLRKQFRGREVKSRVYDSLHSQNQKGKKAQFSKCLKKKNKERDLQECLGPVSREDIEEVDSSNTENDEKSRNGLAEACSPSVTLNNKGGKACSPSVTLNNKGDASRSDMIPLSSSEERNESKDGNEANEESDQVEKNRSIPDKVKTHEVMESGNKQNGLASHGIANAGESGESDDKENCAALNVNRELNLHDSKVEKKKVLGKHETSKSTQKVSGLTGKPAKERSTSVVTGAPGLKHRKPKPTNPKPFRFRTDERGILKEAILEKKLHQAPFTEIKLATLNDHFQGVQISSSKTSNGEEGGKSGTTLQKHQITNVPKEVEANKRMTKSPLMKQLARPRRVASCKKLMVSPVTPDQLGVIDETSTKILRPPKEAAAKPNNRSGAFPTAKASPTTPRSSSRGRRPAATIPKEPNFHSLHVPKSCTKKLA